MKYQIMKLISKNFIKISLQCFIITWLFGQKLYIFLLKQTQDKCWPANKVKIGASFCHKFLWVLSCLTRWRAYFLECEFLKTFETPKGIFVGY